MTNAPHVKEHAVVDHAKVEAQAKHLMDSFLHALGAIEQDNRFGLEREGLDAQTREPKKEEPNEHFRRAFFANAPHVKDNQLQMERKQW